MLDQPYAAAHATPSGRSAYASTPQEVDAQFGPALAAQPAAPATFTLYFVEARTSSPTNRSRSSTASSPRSRGARCPTCVVVGHTDAVGSDQFNDALGRSAPTRSARRLIARGVAARRHPGHRARQARAGGADRRRRRRAAQPARRDHRPLTLGRRQPAARTEPAQREHRDVVGRLGARRERGDVGATARRRRLVRVVALAARAARARASRRSPP